MVDNYLMNDESEFPEPSEMGHGLATYTIYTLTGSQEDSQFNAYEFPMVLNGAEYSGWSRTRIAPLGEGPYIKKIRFVPGMTRLMINKRLDEIENRRKFIANTHEDISTKISPSNFEILKKLRLEESRLFSEKECLIAELRKRESSNENYHNKLFEEQKEAGRDSNSSSKLADVVNI